MLPDFVSVTICTLPSDHSATIAAVPTVVPSWPVTIATSLTAACLSSTAVVADSDVNGGAELWVTDGTAAHSSRLYTQASSSDFDDNFALAAVGGYALFEAMDSSGVDGLFSARGASGACVELLTGRQGLYALQPSAITVAARHAFFSAYDSSGRQGLSAFAPLDDLWFLIRCVDPPTPPLPARFEVHHVGGLDAA